MISPILHAIARDGLDWLGEAMRLEADGDGALSLASLPGPADGKAVRQEGAAPALIEGLAVAADGSIAEADPARGLIELLWPGCAEPLQLGYRGLGPVRIPGPLAWIGATLAAIDRADNSIALLDSTSGALLDRFTGPFTTPIGLAADDEGHLLVLDAVAPFLHRLNRGGQADPGFRAQVDAAAPADSIAQPVALARGQLGWTLVADAQQGLLAFDDEGHALGPIAGLPAGTSCGAIAASGDRLYLHDRTAGQILALSAASGQWLGALPHWSGPLAALAVTQSGDLWIKPEPALSRLSFKAGQAFTTNGMLMLGPLDAGEEQAWYRLQSASSTPPGTALAVLIAGQDAAAPVPADADYQPVSSNDVCLAPPLPEPDPTLGLPPPPQPPLPLSPRYLWVKLILSTADPLQSPRLDQVAVATRGEPYIDQLPGFMGEQNPAGSLLDRLCDILGLSITAAADAARAWPQALDPESAPDAMIGALLGWLDCPAPDWLPVEVRRLILRTAVQRHLRRGTASGMAEEIRTESGLDVAVREGFLDRRIWRLDEGWGLGFDTALPPADAEGLLVGGAADGDPASSPLFPGALAGAAIVGPDAGYGAALFADQAYRFMIVAPPRSDEAALGAAAAVAGRDRPAHTVFGVCRAPEGIRLGAITLGPQARLGVPDPAPIEEWRLGESSRLQDPAPGRSPIVTLGDTYLGGPHGG